MTPMMSEVIRMRNALADANRRITALEDILRLMERSLAEAVRECERLKGQGEGR